jgi:hypothetical protein
MKRNLGLLYSKPCSTQGQFISTYYKLTSCSLLGTDALRGQHYHYLVFQVLFQPLDTHRGLERLEEAWLRHTV